MHAVADALTAHGFAAHAEDRGDAIAVVAEHCPFGDAASQHPVICAVDRGMIRGLLAGLCGQRPRTGRGGDLLAGPRRRRLRRCRLIPSPRVAGVPPLLRPRLHLSPAARGRHGHGGLVRVATPSADAPGDAPADPGRVHTEGRIARALVEDGRDAVATLLGVRPRQVVFTSGGTEAVNAAVWGVTRARPGRPVIGPTSSTRGPCRLGTAGPVGRSPWTTLGRIDLDDRRRILGRDTGDGEPPALVHCQAANHEVGTVQPVAAWSNLRRARRGARGRLRGAGHVPLDLRGAWRGPRVGERPQVGRTSRHRRPAGSARPARRSPAGRRRAGAGPAGRAREHPSAIVGFGAAAACRSPTTTSSTTKPSAARRQTERIAAAPPPSPA